MRKFRVLAALFGLAVATPANATIVFDNFGPGDSYQAGAVWFINAGITQGMEFSPSSSGFFSLLIVALGTTGTPPTAMEMLLQSNNAGQPGTTLETLNFNVTTLFEASGPPTVVAANGSTFLDSSMNYWLTAFSPTGILVG